MTIQGTKRNPGSTDLCGNLSPASLKRKPEADLQLQRESQSLPIQPPAGPDFSSVDTCTSTRRNASDLCSNSTEESVDHRSEAKLICASDLREDIPDLVNIAKPRTELALKAAAAIVDGAAKSTESAVADPPQATANCIREWAEWNPNDDRYEHRIEPMFDEHVKTVAQHVKQHFSQIPDAQFDSDGWLPRLILPGAKRNSSNDDGSTAPYIRSSLKIADIDDDIKGPVIRGYAPMFAFVTFESKHSSTREVYTQNISYSHNIFAHHHTRRFGWGLAGCGSEIRVMLYLPDFVLTSTAMKLSTPEGRRAFIELLVYWSLCDMDQLGYDPTIRRVAGGGCNEIDCYDRASQKTKKLYSRTVLLDTRKVLGRHTRCYAAFPTIEEAIAGSINFASKEAIVIKDAWAQSATGDSGSDDSNEAMHLNHVHDKLQGKDLGFPYVGSVACGDVMLGSGGDFWVDSSDRILSALSEESRKMCLAEGQAKLPNRIHRRLCRQPIGEPLSTVKDETELMRVLLDAMRCHMTLVDDCKLLHRDISENNILVVRQSGKARGLLIDLDHAVRLDVDRGYERRTRTGTLPFMSINNLRGPEHECTALDDWESFLYLICWLATYGINGDDYISEERPRGFAIGDWRYGYSIERIARTKADHMHSAFNFDTNIFSEFRSEYILLRWFARRLHSALFLHEDCAGAIQFKSKYEINPFTNKKVLVRIAKDPLAERVGYEKEILDKIRGLMDYVDSNLAKHK